MEYHEDQEEEQQQQQEEEMPPSFNEKMPIETTPLRKGKYKECLKNHAVGLGGHAVDGCGEFIAAGAEGTLESLRCAACNCHRNFHRKENEALAFHQHQLLLTHGHFSYRSPSGYLHVAPPPQRAVVPLALPSSSGGDDMEEYYNPGGSSGGKKRFRTKFTGEQKEKMLDLAERLGWKIQKQDEELVQQFCNEMGLKRHVLKVWMHNNKHTLGKRSAPAGNNI